MKKIVIVIAFLFFALAGVQTSVAASRNDDHDERRSTPRPTRTATPTPTPTNRPTSRANNGHDDEHRDGRGGRHDDRDDDDRDEEGCEETSTPTPTATPTIMPTSTPVDPTQTPIATQNPDVCPNLEGIQTSLPDEYHFDTAHYNCLKFELGGPSQPSGIGGANVLGTSTVSTGQVLGASTMAGTGVIEDSIFYSLFSIGSLLTSMGIMKNGKKK